MDASAIIPVLEQTALLNLAEYDSKLHKYYRNNETIETQESWSHIWIHEV